jgi:signal peptidase I
VETARRWIVRILAVAAVVLPVTIIALYFLNPFGARSADPRERILGYGVYRVPADSMAPTITRGDILFVRAGYYRTHSPQRGEVATAAAPGIDGPVVKRIVGLPGEMIAILDGRVFVDGKELPELYVSEEARVTPYSQAFPPARVPDSHYFLLGDNRDNSSDSRVWGPVPRSNLHGRVAIRPDADQATSYAP